MAHKPTKVSIGEIDVALKPRTETAIEASAQARRPAQPTPIEPGALTIDEFCRWARAGRTMAYAEIKAGRLRAVKIGSRTVIPMENARAWLASLPQRASAA